MIQQKSNNWIKLLPISVWMLNNQFLSSIQSTPGDLFLGRPYWRLFDTAALHPTQANPTVCTWIVEQARLAESARELLAKHRHKAMLKRDKVKTQARYQIGDLVLVHKKRFPKWKRKKLSSPWWGPYRVTGVTPGAVRVLVSPKLGGDIKVGTGQHLKKYPVSEETFDDLWAELADEAAAAQDELAEVEPLEVEVPYEEPLPFLKVEAILNHKYRHTWQFQTRFSGYPISDSTWETPDAFVVGPNVLNPIFVSYCEQHNLQAALDMGRRRAAYATAGLTAL
jgi:hypothetical protein